MSTELPRFHEANMQGLVQRLESAVKGVDTGHLYYDSAAIRLTLSPGPHGDTYVVLGDPNVSENSNDGPSATLDPYLRARVEAMLALSTDGPGLARCAYCDRFFVQVRSGDRYSRFCPGYDCADAHKRANYERSDYRREYRRRQLALHRLRVKPGAKAAEIKRAEREFDTWKAMAKRERKS
jgi:hypothetical protein